MTEKMRVLFVKPNMGLVNNRPYDDRGRMEPLTFAVLAGSTPSGCELVLCDDRFEPVPYGEKWDLVAINTEIYTARRAYEIAARFRQRGVPVAVGGCHATMLPAEAAAHADAVVCGDAESSWPQLLADLRRGGLKPFYRQPAAGPVAADFFVKDSVFNGKNYLPITLSQFGRGCPNSCEYCATGLIYQRRHGHRPVARVVAELADQKRRTVFFVDDNIIADIAAAKELFRALVPLGIRWTGQASLNFVHDPELVELMVESGCTGLVIGFESLSAENLKLMKKDCNTSFRGYDRAVERIRASGLMVWAAFLLGYDFETEESIRETVDWALSKKFAFAAFNILTPYPGTPFYRRMEAEGRLLYGGRWWLHDDYRFGHAAFRPRQLSAELLSELCLQARLLHNTPGQILRRATDRKTNSKDLWSLLTYFAYNPLFRDEMKKKHGMMLGYRGYERAPTELGEPAGGLWLEKSRTALTGLAGRLLER